MVREAASASWCRSGERLELGEVLVGDPHQPHSPGAEEENSHRHPLPFQVWLFHQKPESLNPLTKYLSATTGFGSNYVTTQRVSKRVGTVAWRRFTARPLNWSPGPGCPLWFPSLVAAITPACLHPGLLSPTSAPRGSSSVHPNGSDPSAFYPLIASWASDVRLYPSLL